MRYVYDSRGYYIRSINLTRFDTYPPNSTDKAPASIPARWNNTEWVAVEEVPEVPAAVPNKVEIKKFKLALLDADLLDTVSSHVAGLPTNVRKRVQIELDNGGNITLEQAKTLLLGVIDDNVIEGLFISAG